MAKAFSLLATNAVSTSATTVNTASISPAAGSVLLLAFYTRSTDLATMSGETLTATGVVDAGWTPVQSQLYDASSRMLAALFVGTGAFTAGTVALGTAAGTRGINRWAWDIIEVSGDGTMSVIQTSKALTPGTGSSVTPTLAAFADPSNATVLFGFTSAQNVTWVNDTAPATYTNLTTLATMVHYAGYLDEDDTSPVAGCGTTTNIVGFAAEVQEAAAGPTITVQPSADVVLINGDPTRASAAYSVTATGTGTLLYDWELETSVGGGAYSNVADGNGATWTGQAAASLTATFTAKTLSGRRVRCNVTDDNGTTTTNAVLLTVYTGPVLSKSSGTTNASGVDTLTITSDYPNGVGEYTETTATSRGITKTVSQVFA